MDNLLEKTKFEISDIIKILPHRYPFILIDKIEIIKPVLYYAQCQIVVLIYPFLSNRFLYR